VDPWQPRPGASARTVFLACPPLPRLPDRGIVVFLFVLFLFFFLFWFFLPPPHPPPTPPPPRPPPPPPPPPTPPPGPPPPPPPPHPHPPRPHPPPPPPPTTPTRPPATPPHPDGPSPPPPPPPPPPTPPHPPPHPRPPPWVIFFCVFGFFVGCFLFFFVCCFFRFFFVFGVWWGGGVGGGVGCGGGVGGNEFIHPRFCRSPRCLYESPSETRTQPVFAEPDGSRQRRVRVLRLSWTGACCWLAAGSSDSSARARAKVSAPGPAPRSPSIPSCATPPWLLGGHRAPLGANHRAPLDRVLYHPATRACPRPWMGSNAVPPCPRNRRTLPAPLRTPPGGGWGVAPGLPRVSLPLLAIRDDVHIRPVEFRSAGLRAAHDRWCSRCVTHRAGAHHPGAGFDRSRPCQSTRRPWNVPPVFYRKPLRPPKPGSDLNGARDVVRGPLRARQVSRRGRSGPRTGQTAVPGRAGPESVGGVLYPSLGTADR